MERWEGLTLAIGALAKNMQDLLHELNKTVGPVEVDSVSVSDTVAMVKLKHGFDELSEKMEGVKKTDYKWAKFIETNYGDFYVEKTMEERNAYVDEIV